MKIKILSWNVRGLNETERRTSIKSLISKWRADIVCLQETKFEEWSPSWVNQLWGSRWVEWAELKSNRKSGGSLILRDKRQLIVRDIHRGSYTFHV